MEPTDLSHSCINSSAAVPHLVPGQAIDNTASFPPFRTLRATEGEMRIKSAGVYGGGAHTAIARNLNRRATLGWLAFIGLTIRFSTAGLSVMRRG
jgi:hypothetical protein